MSEAAAGRGTQSDSTEEQTMDQVSSKTSPSPRRWIAGVGLLALCGCGSGSDTGDSSGPGPITGTPGDRLGPPLEAVDLDFTVDNPTNHDRRETVSVSIPLPEGRVWDLSNFGVAEHETAWLPLQYWADRSVRVAQAQLTVDLDANESKTLRVDQGTRR